MNFNMGRPGANIKELLAARKCVSTTMVPPLEFSGMFQMKIVIKKGSHRVHIDRRQVASL
jgi:hypothetical protein